MAILTKECDNIVNYYEFEEVMLLQMMHQKIKFNLKDFLEFDYKFTVDIMSFTVTFAFIFIQFYYY